jgi:ABC-2 type transport system ATP-binding protein
LIQSLDAPSARRGASVKFLTNTGHMCTEWRQEFILLSDTLGVSMLVDAINNRKPSGATESTVLGPFHVAGAPKKAMGDTISLDGKGDPRAGMVGGSYGGGIQFATAATDCRVDAIVPTIAWHSLVTSLGKADTYKSGWSNLLYSATTGRNIDPHITQGHDEGNATGVISPDVTAWFKSRGPGDDLMNQVKIPTLIIQGTVDTLFTLDEAVSNYGILRKNNVPTAMLWFCGGHGVCLTKSDAVARRNAATKLWLQRWLERDASVDTGPRIDIIDQNAARYTADDYPLPTGTPITADGTGTLTLKTGGGSGPAVVPAGSKQVLGPIVADITPARATNAVNVKIAAPATTAMVVGAPKLDLTYSGTVAAGPKPMRVFAQLVDDTTGVVIGNQITPIKVELDGASHTASVPLEMISFSLVPGASVTLQLVATTGAYATPRLGGNVAFTKVHVELPVVTGLTRKG